MQIDNRGSKVLEYLIVSTNLGENVLRRRLTQRRFDQHALVELLDIRRNTESGHRVENTQGVTPFEKFVSIPFMQSPGNKQNDIVDHVRVAAGASSKTGVSGTNETQDCYSRHVLKKLA